MIAGRCECGKVKYRVDAEITDFNHCHCSHCRRLYGAEFVRIHGLIIRYGPLSCQYLPDVVFQ